VIFLQPECGAYGRIVLRLFLLSLLGLLVFIAESKCVHAYSFNAPSGPRFTAAQKQVQLAAGKDIVPLVVAAFKRGAVSVTIPPGDYRFGSETWGPHGPIYPLEFDDLRRDAAHSFTIVAKGVTFWFDLPDDQAPTCHFCLGFNRCSHIIVDGLTLDRGTRGNIEGRITQIDYDNNRLEIEVCDGVTAPATFNNQLEQRMLPFKSDGKFCAPLYALQGGGVHLKYASITPATLHGHYWVKLADTKLLTTNRDANWIKAYGAAGTLSVGDGLSLIYTVSTVLGVEECDRMTFKNVSDYIAKGGFDETGGYGAHLWKNCYSGPRPGSNQWQGGEGYLCNSMMHGSTYDNFTFLHTSDDVMNIHGYWGNVQSASGNAVTFKSLAADAAPGDTVIFYDNLAGSMLGRATVMSISGNNVTFNNATGSFAGAVAEWPGHECAGWTIENCNWADDYQRLLIQSGPGTINHCRLTRLGSCVEIKSYLGSGNEGGVPNHITIANNVFNDVAPAPLAPTIVVGAYTQAWKPMAALVRDINITGNTINNSGGPAVHLDHCKGCAIRSNIFDKPLAYTVLAIPDRPSARQPVQLFGCSGIDIERNRLNDPGGFTAVNSATGSRLVGVDGQCTQIKLDDMAVR